MSIKIFSSHLAKLEGSLLVVVLNFDQTLFFLSLRLCGHTWLPQPRGAEEGALWQGGRHLGVRRDPLHPPRGLPALLGRGPAQALRADQGRGL